MFRKPFVYFSEAIVTPTKSASIIATTAAQYGGTPVLPVQDLWTRAALSVKRQAALYRYNGYKGESWHNWLSDTIDMVADSVQFEHEDSRSPFKADLMRNLGKPGTYYVPRETRDFIELLAKSGIGWGIIANENHMYQAVLKLLRLNPPGPIVSAAGPTLFKPLPRMWSRAIARAPAQSKHDIWFVGSVLNPCDNMAQNDTMRCALLSPSLSQPDPVSQHFRISCLDDLRKPLLGSDFEPMKQLLETNEDMPAWDGDDDVVLRRSSVPLLSREGQELNVASLKKKISV